MFGKRHTGANMKDLINEIKKSYQCSTLLHIGDHAASVQNGIRQLESKDSNNVDSVCNCHELNTVLLDTASFSQTIQEDLDKLNDLSLLLCIQAVSQTWAIYYNTKTQKSPFKVYVKTRWHSRYDQVACLILNWNLISDFIVYVEKVILPKNKTEDSFKNLVSHFKKINQKTLEHFIFFCKLTKPIRELIKKFEIRKFSTISFLIFGIQKAIHYISKVDVLNYEH